MITQCWMSYRPSNISNTPASIPTERSWPPNAAFARFLAPRGVCSPNGWGGTPLSTSTGVTLTSP